MSAHVALAVGLLAWTLLEREAVAQPAAAARAAAASGRLSGRVVSIAAGSIADAVVTLTRIEPSAPAPLTIASDRQGAFTFERVPAGEYRLEAGMMDRLEGGKGFGKRVPRQVVHVHLGAGRKQVSERGGIG